MSLQGGAALGQTQHSAVFWKTVSRAVCGLASCRFKQRIYFYFTLGAQSQKQPQRNLLTAGKETILPPSFSKQKLGLSSSLFFFFLHLMPMCLGIKLRHTVRKILPPSCFDIKSNNFLGVFTTASSNSYNRGRTDIITACCYEDLSLMGWKRNKQTKRLRQWQLPPDINVAQGGRRRRRRSQLMSVWLSFLWAGWGYWSLLLRARGEFMSTGLETERLLFLFPPTGMINLHCPQHSDRSVWLTLKGSW